MVDPNITALVFSDGASSRMLREVIRAVGCPIAYETSVAAFTPDALEESGASIVIVDLGSDAEADSIFDLLDDDRYRVIINDAEVTSGLTGWDHARWARHLAAKILDLPGVVDPPRPEEPSIVVVDAIASMKSKSRTESHDSDVSAENPLSSSADLGIDGWLSEVLQVKDPAGLFAASTQQEQGSGVEPGGVYGTAAVHPDASESRRNTFPEAAIAAEQIPAPKKPIVAEPAKLAAEERFGWKIDDVIRGIDEWLPPADPDLANIDPARAARLWSSAATEDAPEFPITESRRLDAAEHQRLALPAAAEQAPIGDTRWVTPVQTAAFTAPVPPIGIAAMKDSRSGHLATSLELTPLEMAAVMPLSDVHHPEPATDMVVDVVPTPATVSRVVVLCASVGGPEAIRVVLGAIPANHPALFLVVQQVGEEFLDLLSQQLRRATALRVRSADLGDQLRDGEVIPVSPRQRLVIDRSGRVTLNQRMDEVGAAPMNRVLRDVSDQFGKDCTAVVLSGVASDAAEGCRYVSERGGDVCAQAPASCVSSGMVEQVQQTGVVSFMGTPTELAAHLLLDRR